MVILLFCITVNALLSVIFKLYGIFRLNVFNAIVINYWVCVITGSIFYQKWIIPLDFFDKSWAPYAIFLGFVFISIFNIVARTVHAYGILVATIFQKMSLIAPSLLGMIVYHESHSLTKGIGIFLAMASIVLISHPNKKRAIQWSTFWLPALTLVGSSIIEITLYYVNKENIAPNADIRFVGSLFFCAGIFGLTGIFIQIARRQWSISKADILGGIALGIPNFFSIYLVLVLLARGWEGSDLFPILNVGILALASVAGILFFREKLDLFKTLGFTAALVAIWLVSK